MSDKIINMFSGISAKYDLLNDIFSFGIHRRWRKKTVKLSNVKKGDSIIDIATGTGDLAFEFQKMTGKTGRVAAVDYSREMLNIAKAKYASIEFHQGDALDLKFPDNSFDIASISFGIRNVDSIEKCLLEMARIVRGGGRVAILEFGQPIKPIRIPFKFFSLYFIPLIGKLFTGSDEAFHYLRNTSEKFPCRENFIDIMSDTGLFSNLKYYSLTMGIAYVYVGIVK